MRSRGGFGPFNPGAQQTFQIAFGCRGPWLPKCDRPWEPIVQIIQIPALLRFTICEVHPVDGDRSDLSEAVLLHAETLSTPWALKNQAELQAQEHTPGVLRGPVNSSRP